ncbi:MAG TPA: hypothetical protein PKG56_00070 [Chitinophagaceae bacterium]|nr:hypothetical protein [Chitinophagaceae bacterium]HNL81761.1 hypothetical protein [Chitinophagaceae bacterium]
MDIIKYFENVPLSDKNVLDLVNGRANIVLYQDLHKYDNIDQVLGPYGATFLLYEFKPKYGHWVALFKRTPKVIEYFDSYGNVPDEVLDHIPIKYQKLLHQDYPYLSKLLYESPYNIEYNEHHFQKLDKNIRTCGRFAGLRILFRHFTLNKFAQIFDNPYSDKLATYFTMWVNN